MAILLAALALTGLLVRGVARARRATGRRGEARFRALVQNAAELVAIVDSDGTLNYASPAAHAVLGIEPDAAVGAPLAAYAHLRHALEASLARPRANLVDSLRVRHQDGSWRHVEVITTLAKDHQVGQVVVAPGWACWRHRSGNDDNSARVPAGERHSARL